MSDPVDVLARTLIGEAQAAGAAGMRHVASVILNRVLYSKYGDDIVDVCMRPCQFACWNSTGKTLARITNISESDPWFLIAKRIAISAVHGKLVDETDGADTYYALKTRPPPWIGRARHTYSDGWHSFWRIELPGPSGYPEAPTISMHSVDI